MKELLRKRSNLKRRQNRIRAKVSGTATIPRLSVSKTNTALYCQLIDDVAGKTLISLHSKNLADVKSVNLTTAKKMGNLLAKKALEKKIHKVVFDRRGRKYTGRIAAIADSARESGLTL